MSMQSMTNELEEWKVFLIIGLSVIGGSILLGIIVLIICYMTSKTEKREDIHNLNIKSSSTEKTSKSMSATKSFSVTSSRDYSKLIDLKSKSTIMTSTNPSRVKKPNELKVK